MTGYEPEPREHARRTDPATSHAAAASLGSQQTMMRSLLTTYADAERTCEEAADVAGYEHERATKRVSDLLRSGLIEDTGATRPGRSGREQMVCRLTVAGWAALL